MDQQRVVLQNLPTSVKGFCFLDEDGEPVVVVNSRLTWEQNVQAYEHEQRHIRNNELTEPSYIEYKEGFT